VGLLVLRVAAASVVIAAAVVHLRVAPSATSAALDLGSIAIAGLLLAGIWTPVSAALIAAAGLWCGVSSSALSSGFLVMAIGAALVMLGPGAWSVDARLYGWRRIDVRR